mmetsp:Transcript_55289/g.131331  ORF Transcript_55289/g.131331 Transcript_55289/m.131331 type:complete len:209 (-) Transcript_55289:662-1288(-)
MAKDRMSDANCRSYGSSPPRYSTSARCAALHQSLRCSEKCWTACCMSRRSRSRMTLSSTLSSSSVCPASTSSTTFARSATPSTVSLRRNIICATTEWCHLLACAAISSTCPRMMFSSVRICGAIDDAPPTDEAMVVSASLHSRRRVQARHLASSGRLVARSSSISISPSTSSSLSATSFCPSSPSRAACSSLSSASIATAWSTHTSIT